MGVLRVFACLLALSLPAVSRAAEPASTDSPVSPVAEEIPEEATPAGEITLRQAAALALVRHPDLLAYSYETRATEARILQAGLRPNPELSLEIEDLRWRESAETRTRTVSVGTDGLGYEWEREGGAAPGLDTAETTVALSQVIELGGKRLRRIRLAETERELARWDYEAVRVDVLSGVARAYVDLLGAQERLRLQEELVTLSGQVREATAARVEAGKVSPLELTRAETELAALELARDAAARETEAARIRLAASFGASEPTFERAAGTLEDAVAPPSLESLLQTVESNPDLARWADEMDRRLAALELERAQRVPDLTLTGGFRTQGLDTGDSESWSVGTDFATADLGVRRSDTGLSRDRENSLVLAASLPLPLRNRNQGAIQEAELRVEQANAQRDAAELRVRSSLSAGYQDLRRAGDTALRIRDSILPRAQDTFERTQIGYREGKFGFLEVLDAQRTLFEVRRQYIDALVDYHQALADVERLIGQPLSALGGDLSAPGDDHEQP
jgi:cobalt-zinc-cadmium efflux system outer membrane protein